MLSASAPRPLISSPIVNAASAEVGARSGDGVATIQAGEEEWPHLSNLIPNAVWWGTADGMLYCRRIAAVAFTPCPAVALLDRLKCPPAGG